MARASSSGRRRHIIESTRELIAQRGPSGLSLRTVAKHCGMTAPGVLHHFGGLDELLAEVLAERDAEEQAAATAFVAARGEDATLRDFADALVLHVQQNSREARNFDALEAEATARLDHPARGYYLSVERPFPPAVILASREYDNAETVLVILGLVMDGLRHRWLRADEVPDYWADWAQVRDLVFAALEPMRKAPKSTAVSGTPRRSKRDGRNGAG